MAKQAYVYSGTDWVPLASEVTNLTGYQTKALNQFAHRNLVINGDMQIAQRGTSVASITAASYNTADRWQSVITTQGTWTQSVENDAPTGSGFAKSLKMLCTTADASPAAGDLVQITQRIEGQNLQHIKKGTSAAEQITVSFWVKSNVTGTYIVELYDLDNTRSVSKSYTINASATWEKETITFPADTTGAFDNDNAGSLRLNFWLGSGTDYTSGTLATTWVATTNANRAVGQTNLASAISNYWQVTGVQLEVGDTATPFEFKSVEDELLECQRYYFRVNAETAYALLSPTGAAESTGRMSVSYNHPVPMRAQVTSIDYANVAVTHFGVALVTTSSFAIESGNSNRFFTFVHGDPGSGLTQYRPGVFLANNNANAYFGMSAEL
jgi:phage gp37-like protein